jgi:two-component system sensor histidine kinase MprB
LRARIGLLVMLAVGLSVSVAAGVNYLTVKRTVLQQLDTTLAQTANPDSAYFFGGVGSRGLAGLGTDRVSFFVDSNGNAFLLQPVNQNTAIQVPLAGTHLSGFQSVVGSTETAIASGTVDQATYRTVTVGGTTYRLYEKQVSTYTLVTAQSMGNTNHTLNQLAISSLLVALSGILLAGVAGFGIGRTGLRPVDRLTEATEHIARTGDLTPIEVHGQDELARLATSFNSMLGALARSREYQKRLVADAGHELRTPLTSMRTNIDLLAQSFALAESGQLSAADRDELIADVKAQLAELSMLVSDLVELSRDEPHAVVWQDLDLADVVHAAAERVRRRAPNVRFALHVEPWNLRGDTAALERAVTNLLDNAAKFSPPDGTVTVKLHGGLLQVADEGPGIAEADLAHVFERFYRSPEARSAPGSGLGLAIVKQAVENHGGRVAAGRAANGGALLSAWLPGTADGQAAGGKTSGNRTGRNTSSGKTGDGHADGNHTSGNRGGRHASNGNGAVITDVTPPTALPPGSASAK